MYILLLALHEYIMPSRLSNGNFAIKLLAIACAFSCVMQQNPQHAFSNINLASLKRQAQTLLIMECYRTLLQSLDGALHNLLRKILTLKLDHRHILWGEPQFALQSLIIQANKRQHIPWRTRFGNVQYSSLTDKCPKNSLQDQQVPPICNRFVGRDRMLSDLGDTIFVRTAV